MLAQLPTAFTEFGSLGAAGIMGAMWLWERRNSRKRDEQIDAAHERIMADQLSIAMLVDVVKANTRASEQLAHAVQELLQQHRS